MFYPGCSYITGNISPYIAAYFNNMPVEKTSNLFLACLVLVGCLLPIGTWFVSKNVNPKIMIGLAGFLGMTLMFLASCCRPD